MYAGEHGNGAAGCTLGVTEANLGRRACGHGSRFSREAEADCFTAPKPGGWPQGDEAVLRLVTETRVKIARHMPGGQWEPGEIARTLGIDETQFTATRGRCN